ncbi:proline-rich protein 7 [Clupea harengus]|uniref:Proline-rich protein 7 n=1 Tax=Clupea harengus TaxID=7950 RepID=A0A6P8FP13_CLUHA|nr:proline-rich protein 7 [Clupea harengus]
MEMSQGTYTFLVCFAGFWLVWGLMVILCCFCSSVQRRLKRERREQLREQCLRPLEMEPLGGHPSLQLALPLPPHREPPQFYSTHPLSPPFSLSPPRTAPLCPSRGLAVSHRGYHAPQVPVDSDPCGQPPCYEEAVLMEDPPPPYNEVLAEPPRAPPVLRATRDSSSSSSSGGGGGTLKAPPRPPRVPQEPDISKTNPESMGLLSLPGRGCSTLIRLPPAPRRWDSLGRLPALGLEHRGFPMEPRVSFIATMPREGRTHAHGGGGLGLQLLRELEEDCGLPTAYPLLGRSTAV